MSSHFDGEEKVEITGEYLCELYDREEETLLTLQRLMTEQLAKLQVRVRLVGLSCERSSLKKFVAT
jgi:hypothetical protein